MTAMLPNLTQAVKSVTKTYEDTVNEQASQLHGAVSTATWHSLMYDVIIGYH